MFYDPQGRLQKIAIAGDGKISLVDGQDVGEIRSAAIEISLDSETQIVQTIRSLTRCTLTQRGKENLKVSGDKFLASYSKAGALSGIHAQKRCHFETDELNGQAEEIRYDVAQAKIEISGRNSTVSSGKNTFSSNQFLIHTRTRQLVSTQKVKATLVPGKKSVLLGAKPAVRHRRGHWNWARRAKRRASSGDVSLFQDEIEMHAGELLFESRANRISCRGDADLKFARRRRSGGAAREYDRLRPGGGQDRHRGRGPAAAGTEYPGRPQDRAGCSAATTSWRTSTPPSRSASARARSPARRSSCTGSSPARPSCSATPPRSPARMPGRPAARNCASISTPTRSPFPAPATAPRRPSAGSGPRPLFPRLDFLRDFDYDALYAYTSYLKGNEEK